MKLLLRFALLLSVAVSLTLAAAASAPAASATQTPPQISADDDPLATLRPGHPRLLFTPQDWAAFELRVKNRARDPLFNASLSSLEKYARKLLSSPPLTYKKVGHRLLTVANEAMRRVTTLAAATNATLTLLGTSTFSLGANATLSAGGGNTIQTNNLTIASGAAFAFDLTGWTTGNTPMLTLNATTFNINSWAQTLNLTGLNTSLTTSSSFSLLSLAGTGAAANPFTATSFGNLLNVTGLESGFSLGFTANSLFLLYTVATDTNSYVLTWAGNAGNGNWSSANWLRAGETSGTTFKSGDVINLANITPAPATTDINLDASASIAGLYVSGNENFKITGTGVITASATAGGFDPGADLAATGKLVVGGSAAGNGSAAATVAYAGVLTLENASNNFTGGIVINSGALTGNAASLGAGGATGPGITVNSPGTLTFSQTTNATYAAPIAGAGALVKAGGGALTLSADNSGFTGAATVSTGKILLANNAVLGGDITVRSGATLGGTGTASAAAKTVTLDGGILQIGSGTSGGQTFSILGNLALNADSILDFLTTSSDNQLFVAGLITQTGTSFLQVDALATGSYALINAAGGWAGGSFNNTLLGVHYDGRLITLGTDYTFTTAGDLLWLNILSVSAGINNVLTWSNAASDNLWFTSTNWAWSFVGDSGNKSFEQGDIVNLGGTTSVSSSPVSITLANTATASAIYVSGTASYVLAGAGALVTATGVGDIANGSAANGKLVLGKTAEDKNTITPATFTGTLDLTALTGTNTFAAGIEITTGALRVSTLAQLGTPLSQLTFTGTGALIAAGDLYFDSAGAAANRLVIPARSKATIMLEDGKTFTFANNAPGVVGGAINIGGTASLTLTAGAGAQFVFSNNSGASAGAGAINVNNGATLTLDGSSLASGGTTGAFLFTGNNATGGRGGAIDVLTATFIADHVTFQSNTNTGNGGALSIVNAASTTGGTGTLSNVLFTGNSGNNGGALFLNTGVGAVVQSATFSNNKALAGGGAIMLQTSSTLTLRDALVSGNFAATTGGGIAVQNDGSRLNLLDVTLVNNTGTTNGGAIYMANNTNLAIDVSAGATAQIAGNKMGATATPNSIYFNAATIYTFTASVATGGTLDMLDPMNAPSNATLTITKTGSGAWNLGGANTLGNATSVVNFNVTQGTFRLTAANETSTGPGGVFTTTAPAALTIGANNANTFSLASGATLAAGAGAALNAPVINLASNSIIALDLLGATTSSPAILTLNATGATGLVTNSWNQRISLLNVASLGTLTDGDTFNLIALGSGKTFGNIDLLTLVNNPNPSLYHLQLDPGNASILQLYYGAITLANNVLTWTGAAGNNLWGGNNWALTSNLSTSATYARGDIVNLAGAAPGASATINVDSGVNIAGMAVSGGGNYTITGAAIVTNPDGSAFTGSAAATGALTLGAQAAGDASALTTLAYTGTLTLDNGANNFMEGIEIRGGALVGNATSLGVGSTAGITIAAPGSLTFAQTANATYAAPITGAGSLAKTGAGALTLTANSGAFTGTTTVAAGKLFVGATPATPAAALGGAIRVSNGATFGGSGTAGAVTLASGATLQIGLNATGAQDFWTANLSLGTGSILDYLNLANVLHVGGAITQDTGASTITLSVNTLTTGSYAIIDATAGLATLNTNLFNVIWKDTLLGAGSEYNLVASGNQLWLSILALPDIANNVLDWSNAAGNNAWLGSANWTVSGTNTNKNFLQADIVNLVGASLATPSTITLASTATTAAIYVSGTTSHAITGPGALVTATGVGDFANATANPAAAGRLVLGKIATTSATAAVIAAFDGTLDLTGITGANNFAQGIEINSGALRVANARQLGTSLSLLNIAGTGTLIAASHSALSFNGAGGATQRLNIPATGKAAIILEDGATLTIAGGIPGADGGAINVSGGASLTLVAGAGARFEFNGNTGGNAGAIATAASSTLVLDGSAAGAGGGFFFDGNKSGRGGAIDVNNANVTIINATFTNNESTANGGAISVVNANGKLTLNGALITGNRAAGANHGGGIFINTSGYALVQSSTISGNTAGTQSGGISVQGSGTAVVRDSLIANNTGGQGGGFTMSGNNCGAELNRVIFSGNTGNTNGGGIFLNNSANFRLALTDVSIVNNTTPSNGGALFLNSDSTLTLPITVSPGFTAQIAGNKAGANAVASSFYVNTRSSITSIVDIGAGGSLDWLDPVTINSNVTLNFTKTGDGAWRLGGVNNLTNSGAAININITAGRFHLLGPGEVSSGAAGVFTTSTIGTLSLGAATSSCAFTVGAGATLSAGGLGGSQLTVNNLTLDAGAILGFDLSHAQAGRPALLTLSSGNPAVNNWSQSINLLSIDGLDHATSGVYNLLALNTANLAVTNPFLPESFGNLANATGLYDGYSLAITEDGQMLQLVYNTRENSTVLTWGGGAGGAWNGGGNWHDYSGSRLFIRGDIANLANTSGETGINLAAASTSLAGLYVSGTDSFTITGGALAATANAGSLTAFAAASGKLVLGAQAVLATSTLTDPETGLDYTIITNATVSAADFTGTLTLANTSNNFAGGIEINSGHLVGNAASLGVGASTGIAVADGASLTFDQRTAATYAAPISGAGALFKTGSGALTLTAANSITGPTSVLAGSLLLDHSTLGGDVTVANRAKFGGIGTVGGSLTIADGGVASASTVLQVGLGKTAGQSLNILGDLVLADGMTINYTAPTDSLHVGGAIAQTGSLTLNFDVFMAGTFNIGNLAPLLGNATVTVGDEPQYIDARQQTNLVAIGSDLFAIGAGDASRILTWTGSTDGTWALTGANWANSATGVFAGGDRVMFDDSVPGARRTANVTRVKGVYVSDMIVNTASSYTITGYGIISQADNIIPGAELSASAGTGKLTLAATNTGTLTLANNGNDFTNGIAVLGGELAISGSTRAGGVSNVAAGATLRAARGGNLVVDELVLAAGSILTAGATGRGTITGNIVLVGPSAAAAPAASSALAAPAATAGYVIADIAASGTLRLAATTASGYTITGAGAFRKTGAGTLELWGAGALSNTGVMQIDEGTVRLAGGSVASAANIANTIQINNGNLVLSYGTGAVNYNTAADWGTGLVIIPGPTAATTGTITGSNDILHFGPGTVVPQLSGGLHVAVDAADGVVELGNARNDFTGAIIVNSGTFRVADIEQIGANAAGTKVALNGGVLQISTDSRFLGNIDIHNPAAPGNISVDAGVSSTWAGITQSVGTGNNAIARKTGAGTFTLLGTLAATELVVDEGRWIGVASTVGTPNAISNNFLGPVTINAGGVFELALAPATGVTGTLGYFAGRSAAHFFIPTAAAAINNPFMGEGTLEITNAAARLNFTSPRTTIANVNIGPGVSVAIQATSFSPAGTITVGEQGKLILAANEQILGNIILKNGAAMGFLRSGTLVPAVTDSDANVITPAYYTLIGPPNKRTTIASLAADGEGAIPNLWFGADISGGTADRLAITGAVTGTFAVNVIFEGTNAPSKGATNLELISAPAAGSEGEFVIADNSREVDIGLYKYTVDGVAGPGGTYSVAITGDGDMSRTAAAIYSAAAALPITWFAEMTGVSQRMGELHHEQRDAKAGLSAWVRGFDERLEFNKKLTGARFNQLQFGAEAGVDYKVSAESNTYFGAYAGYGRGRRDRNDPIDSTSESTFGGLYLTSSGKTGWYVDVAGKLNTFKNRFTVTDPATARATRADYNTWAIGASLELGKHHKLPHDWFLEPQVQIAFASIAGGSYETDNGTWVLRRSGIASRGRAGFRFGHDIETNNLGTIGFYLKGYYGRQWTSDGRLTAFTRDGQYANYAPGIKGITLTGGAGLSWLITHRTQLYFDYETTQADHYIKPYGLNFGVRHSW